MILSGLFGNVTAAKVLLYLENYDSGYPSGIATVFDVPVSQVQRQLEKMELEGIFSSRLIGKTRSYSWNPRCFYIEDLRSILKKALAALPDSQNEKYLPARRLSERASYSRQIVPCECNLFLKDSWL